MRTIDRFLAGRTRVSNTGAPHVGPSITHAFAQEMLPSATILVADNVADYVRSRNKPWVLEDVGCLAPPWPVFWIEYHNQGTERRGVMAIDLWPALETKILHAKNGHDWMESQDIPEVARMVLAEDAVLKEELERDEREILNEIGRKVNPQYSWPARPDSLLSLASNALQDVQDQGGNVDEVRFCVALLLFGEVQKEVTGPVAWLVLALDRYGRVMGNRWQLTPELHKALKLGENEARDDANFVYVLNMLHPALQTIAFLHCRNVVTDSVRPNPKLSHKHQKRTGRPLMRYQTVRLEVPRRAGTSGGAGGAREASSLHIVAGHMAHYGECGCPTDAHPPKGKLFGKLDGIFWVPDHARGDRTAGAVATDFEVVV